MGRTIVSKTFAKWCNETNNASLLELWDCEKNADGPNIVGYRSPNKYFFKCSRGIHESTPRIIKSITEGKVKLDKTFCKACNSIGQEIIDEYGEEYFGKVWSKKNTQDPFKIQRRGKGRFYLVCLQDETHPDYEKEANHFKADSCPYCAGQKVCYTNSLGYLHPEVVCRWDESNEKNPFEVPETSTYDALWNCENAIHDDYRRQVGASKACLFRCPECSKDNQIPYNFIDLTDCEFGLWTVLGYDKEKSKEKKSTYWKCRCKCGTETSVLSDHLRGGVSKSCGCRWKTATAGESNYNWKGGVSSKNGNIRNSFEGKTWAECVRRKDYYTCQCCGQVGYRLNAHHIINFSDNESERFDLENGILLCEECHNVGEDSFHSRYGKKNNNRIQIEQYINERRKELGFNKEFIFEDYISGDILKPVYD